MQQKSDNKIQLELASEEHGGSHQVSVGLPGHAHTQLRLVMNAAMQLMAVKDTSLVVAKWVSFSCPFAIMRLGQGEWIIW